MNTKYLALAASLVLFAAIPGSADARTHAAGEKQWSDATNAPAGIQSRHLEPGAPMPSQAAARNLHSYYGGPKSND